MKFWSWRRIIIILLMTALPLASYLATVMSGLVVGGHRISQLTDQTTRIAALNAAGAVTAAMSSDTFTVAQNQAQCPLPCQLEMAGICDMAHGTASCLVAITPTLSLASPVGFSLARGVPAELDPDSYISPLLDRPPARLLFLS